MKVKLYSENKITKTQRMRMKDKKNLWTLHAKVIFKIQVSEIMNLIFEAIVLVIIIILLD
jgi:hypothetical protein